MYINFVFWSITFLQSYISSVIDATKINIKSHLFMRHTVKQYADPYATMKKIKPILDIDNIDTLELSKITDYKGFVFVLDGDL